MSMVEWVQDWGGFEQLIAKLHETGEVAVQHNVSLPGRSGAPRQIDVLIRHKQGLYEHLVIVECKYWNKPVERLHVDALATTIREVGAARGVIFSSMGFQQGARTQAEHEHIDLFLVRDLTAREWGLPGRMIDMFLQVIQPSIGRLSIQDVLFAGEAEPHAISLHLEIGCENPEGATRLLNPIELAGQEIQSVEQCITVAAQSALQKFTEKSFTFNGGEECTRYMLGHVIVEPTSAMFIPHGNGTLIIRKISFDLGIKFVQSRIVIDRAESYAFALAVENCITGVASSAARMRMSDITVLNQISMAEPENDDDAFVNGSVIKVYIKGYFDFAEVAELEPTSVDLAEGSSVIPPT